MQSTAVDLLPQTAPSRLDGKGTAAIFHNTRHLMITGWFLMSSCWRYYAHKHRFPPRSVVVCFLCVWCGGGGMQEQELLSTRPHLPTSAMTLWQSTQTEVKIFRHEKYTGM